MERIVFDATKLKIVPIDEVRPNTWNPKEKDTEEYKQVKRSIEINGLKDSIKVRENAGFEIIDGEQKWTACKELGYKNILIYNEGVVTDKQAQELTLWWQTQVPVDELKLASVIKNLSLQFNADIQIPYSDTQIQEYIKLADFDWENYKKEDIADIITQVTIKVTKEQYTIIMSAVDKLKAKEGTEVTEGRAIELICANYLTSA